jgi:small subunit ribosomal protein S7
MRRRRPERRKIVPDPIYNDLVVAKFVNNLMKSGKKSVAEKIFYKALLLIERKEKTDSPIDVFKKALKNSSPMVEVKSRRIGGATYQVPIDIPENRRVALSMRWIISFARSRKGSSMVDKLSAELIAASKNEGSSIKKKEDTHKMAEANKAFAHFR